MKSTLLGASLLAAIALSLNSPLPAQNRAALQSPAGANGIPAGGQYVPPGSLYDNEQSDGVTSLASQNSTGTFTARTADDFRIPTGNCSSGQFDVSGIRLQMVQTTGAEQAFGLDLFDDDGTGNAPTAGLTPVQTFAETSQILLGAFGKFTSIFEVSFATPGLVLNGNTTYWLSGFGANSAANPSGFNNFFATSDGAPATTDNAVIIAPGAGVPNWTPVQQVIQGDPLAFSFAVDGTCRLSEADLSISKTNGATAATPGVPVVYTLVASNAGPAPVTAATVTDTFVAPLTACTWTCAGAAGGTCSAAGSGNIADSVDLPSGGSATYTATCSIPANATGSVSNTASIAGPGGGPTDPNPVNNSAVDTDTLAASADLSITISDSPDPVIAGGLLTYTAIVSNAGPSDASGVVADFLIKLPAPATLVPRGNSCQVVPSAPGTVALTCTLAGIAAGASLTETIQFSVPPSSPNGGVLIVAGTLTSTSTDPTQANNSDSESTNIGTSADLRAELSTSALQTVVNVPVTFTATSLNQGLSDAQNVSVTVNLTPDFRFSSLVAAGATCTSPQVGNTGSVLCTWAGATAPNITRSVQVIAFSNNAGSSAVTTVTASATTDPVPANNNAAVNVQVALLVEGIPALSAYALVLLGLLLGLMSFVAVRRQS